MPCRPPPVATSTGCSTTCRGCRASRHPRRPGTVASFRCCSSLPSSPSWPARTVPFYPMYHVPWFLFVGHRVLPVALFRRSPPSSSSAAHGRRVGAQLGHGPLTWPRTPRHAARTRTPRSSCASSRCSRACRSTSWTRSGPHCATSCTAHPGQVIQAQDVPVRLWHLLVGGHVIVQRDGTPIGLLEQGRLVGRTLVAQPSVLSHRRGGALARHHADLAASVNSSRSPSNTRCWPAASWPVRPASADRLALPIFNALVHLNESSMSPGCPWQPISIPSSRDADPRRRLTFQEIFPNAHPRRVVCPSSPPRRSFLDGSS